LKPSANIGVVGHVDHGKTTLVRALSGVWADRHSEELKRGISIRLGYADARLRRCPSCPEPDCYTVKRTCSICGSKTDDLRMISFVDSPGHETLMATMLSGAALMNGALLIIAANEPCPQPQTREHLMALDIIGIKNIVIAQNKIDLVSREDAIRNYEEIKEFVKGTVAENAPIVPISAQQSANVDLIIQKIEENIPSTKVDTDKTPLMLIARSFDVNRPGIPPDKLKGGVIGGTLMKGKLEKKDEIEIMPGRMEGKGQTPINTTITTLMSGKRRIKEGTPGGLIGVGTKLDPAMTKADALVGQVAGAPSTLPPVWNEFGMEVRLLDRVVGVMDEAKVTPIRKDERLMLSIWTATTVGIVSSVRKDNVDVKLKRPVCAAPNSSVAISRQVGAKWHLIGVGNIKNEGGN
jgi:translation initiation factor 2 subunit 3